MQAILAVTIPFFGLILCGYLAAQRGVLPESAIPGLNGFVLFFALPCMLFRFGAGAPVVRIVGHAGLRLRFAVPPERAGGFAPGTAVTATIDTVATEVAATIEQVSPALDPASGLVLIEAALPNDPTAAALRPGLAARVFLVKDVP